MFSLFISASCNKSNSCDLLAIPAVYRVKKNKGLIKKVPKHNVLIVPHLVEKWADLTYVPCSARRKETLANEGEERLQGTRRITIRRAVLSTFSGIS